MSRSLCRPSFLGATVLALLAGAAAAETPLLPPASIGKPAPKEAPRASEAVRPDLRTSEAPKPAESFKPDPAKPDPSRSEASRTDVPKAEPPKAEAPKAADAPRPADASKAAEAQKPAQPAATPPAPAGADAPKPPRREPPPLVVARISSDPVPTYGPSTFLDTMRAADAHRAVAEGGGWPAVPAGQPIKFGEKGPAVAALKARLVASGDLDQAQASGDAFDPPLLAAAKRFQARHGLPETGLVGAKTIEAMNVPAATRHRQLAASAARLMGSSFAFGERYVTVNVPSAAVEAVAGGKVERRYVAVVGRPDRATPSVETRITNVNLNPTWTVPVSLIKKDIIPHVRKDPAYLAKMQIRVLDGQGQEVDPATIDWSTEKAVNYTIRQDPGSKNSLGQVRIDMPNKHAVYLHDTPQKRLFGQDVRFHSSGCVRVSDVKSLVAWLLQGTPGPSGAGSSWGAMEIETGIATGERRDVKLARPVPVAFVYLTGYATPDGRAHFREDVYGLDAQPEAAAPTPAAQLPAAQLPAAQQQAGPDTTSSIPKPKRG